MDAIVLSVDDENEIAAIFTEDGRSLGVNLWEIEGYARRSDGFSTNAWKPI